MQAQMLAPAAVLVLWSLVMLFWMAGTRFPAISKIGSSVDSAKAGSRGLDLEGVIPDNVNWKAHNYSHLMEQPTIFYPTVIILAILGAGPIDVTLAWIYVALRIIHSVYQATINLVKIRFLIFLVSTLTLTVLAVRAAMAALLATPGVIA